jgi:hypothetical protein
LPEPCASSAVGLRVGGGLTIDVPDFYGVIQSAGTLHGQMRLGDRLVLSAAADIVTYRFAANAVVQSSGRAFGPPTVAATRLLPWSRGRAAVYARVLLPVDTARQHGTLSGGEIGVVGDRKLSKSLRLVGGLSLPGTLAVVGGATHATVSPATLWDLEWAPRTPHPWVALALGGAARFEVWPSRALLAVAARPSLRFAIRRKLHLGLGADVPLGISDRRDLSVALFALFSPS